MHSFKKCGEYKEQVSDIMIEWLNETKRAVTPIEHSNRSLQWEGYSKWKAGQSKPCSCCLVSMLGWTPGVHCCGLSLLLQRSRLEGSVCVALHICLAEVTSDSCGQNEQPAACTQAAYLWSQNMRSVINPHWDGPTVRSYLFVHLIIRSLILVPYSFMEFL